MSATSLGPGVAAVGQAEDVFPESWPPATERTPLLKLSAPRESTDVNNTTVGLNSAQLTDETSSTLVQNDTYMRTSSESSGNNGRSSSSEQVRHCHRDRFEAGKVDYAARRKLIAASVVCLVFMVGEIVGGVIANSLAIATDAAHLLTDFASFLISLFALFLGSRPPTKRMSFGWYRAEVMGALLSVLLIWVVTGVLVYMAVERVISQNYEINATIMLITAALSVFFNVIMGFLLHDHGHGHGHSHGHSRGHAIACNHSNKHRHKRSSDSSCNSRQTDGDVKESPHQCQQPSSPANSESLDIRIIENGSEVTAGSHEHESRNINVRAAFIHVLGDLVQSFGVLAAAFIIYYKPEWKLADPICTFIFSVLVLSTTMTILRDILNVLMEGTPRDISFNEVKQRLRTINGVKEVHDLRLWSLTTNRVALSAHLAIDNTVSSQEVITNAGKLVHSEFGIYECTIQAEDYTDEMSDCVHCKDPED